VSNVETLAHLALIARRGADWFAGVGTRGEPGSMLVTLAGAVRRPGVFEIAIGTPIRDVLELSGGTTAPVGALLAGGYFGRWIDPGRALDLPLSAEGLARLGAAPGAGFLGVLPATACGLVETARLARYLADESAGQCGPCVFGLSAVAEQLESLADGRGADIARLRRWIGQLQSGRGACAHPDGTIAMVSSALEVFAGEIEQHAQGWCRGVGRDGRAGVLPVPVSYASQRRAG
jgi:NADH:ubiquinone oxidoreductase subunit F (NADH-binding)